MARRPHRVAPGDIEYLPASAAEQLAHADALRRRGEAHPQRRAQYYAEAAEYYAAAGQSTTAEELFRTALEDGGHVAGSLHGFYAEFLFTHNRPDEALALIETARKQRPDDPDVFVIIGETFDEHGHHEQAARWLTTGLVRYYGDLAEITADDLEDDPDGQLMAADRLRGPPQRRTRPRPHRQSRRRAHRERRRALTQSPRNKISARADYAVVDTEVRHTVGIRPKSSHSACQAVIIEPTDASATVVAATPVCVGSVMSAVAAGGQRAAYCCATGAYR